MPFEPFSAPAPSMTGGPSMRMNPGFPSSPYSAGRGFVSTPWGQAASRGGSAAATGVKQGARNAANRMMPSVFASPWGQRQQATGAAVQGGGPGAPSTAAGPRGGGRGVSKDTKMKAIEGRKVMATTGNPWEKIMTTQGAGNGVTGPIGDWRQIGYRTIDRGNGLVGNMLDRGIRGAGHGAIEGTREGWEASAPPEPVEIADPFAVQRPEDSLY